MTTFRIYKETALPATLEPHSMYLIAPAANPELLEIFVTNADATTPHRHVLNKTEVQAMIDSSINDANELAIVADIAARDALTPTRAKYVYVVDATADTTVESGGATYLYDPSTTDWVKISEAESMDVTLNWADIVGGPTSSPAQIDQAVANSHTHANKTELDLIGQNSEGEMTYNGVQVKTEWSSTAW